MKKPETLMIDNLKYVRADLATGVELPKGDFAPWEIGCSYFIQTVTHYYQGRLVGVTDKELTLTGVAWIANTGRYSEFLSGKRGGEEEVYPPKSVVIVGRGAVVSAVRREVNS